MEVATLVVSLLGLIFGFLGFVTAVGTAVIVLGWKNSTHKIVQLPAQPLSETINEIDAPAEIRDQLPTSPEPTTLTNWVRQQRGGQLEDLYTQSID